jgi:hypothetical protein
MKKLILLSAVISAALALPVLADSKKLEGEATCAKCDLKVADKCQAVVVVTGADGKKETYFSEAGTEAKALHGEICKGGKPATVEGEVSEKDGKKMIKITKFEVK